MPYFVLIAKDGVYGSPKVHNLVKIKIVGSFLPIKPKFGVEEHTTGLLFGCAG